ncbi:MAG: hypothetical protein ACKVVT_01565 [Dehalococcoidia bacterium]
MLRRSLGLALILLAMAATAACSGREPDAPPPAAPEIALPAGLPHHLGLGMADRPGGSAVMRATAPFDYRYQYLAGGVWESWEAWEPGGRFVEAYIAESKDAGLVPVFTYYNLVQSLPDNRPERDRALGSLRSQEIMGHYLRGLRAFFEQAGQAGTTVILHVEPDLWGFAQQAAKHDDPATIPAAVHAAGIPEFAALPETLPGFAQGVVALRDALAPNVLLGIHASNWATGDDFTYSRPGSSEVDGVASRTGAFFRRLDARFDLVFAEFSDRDAGFREHQYGDRGASWWKPEDFARHARFLSGLRRATGLPLVLWQIPYGNTRMAAIDETWDHYGDNRVEWLLDPDHRSRLDPYLAAGVVALLFGRGAAGATDASDASGDGVTNGSTSAGRQPSLSADDDGGLFRAWARAYYERGPLTVP